jgi:hypothetical protein
VPGQGKGRSVMLAMVTFVFLAIALAFPGLISVLMSGALDVQ